MRKAVRVAVGSSRAEEDFFSNAIRYFTRPGNAWRPLAKWSHVYYVFFFDDNTAEIHEALIRERGWCKKDYMKLDAWLHKAPDKHFASLLYLNHLPQEVVEKMYWKSRSWIGTRSYALLQIGVAMLGHTLLGRYLCKKWPMLFSTDVGEFQTVCCEGVAQILAEEYPPYDVRRSGEKFSDLSPDDVMNRLLALIAA